MVTSPVILAVVWSRNSRELQTASRMFGPTRVGPHHGRRLPGRLLRANLQSKLVMTSFLQPIGVRSCGHSTVTSKQKQQLHYERSPRKERLWTVWHSPQRVTISFQRGHSRALPTGALFTRRDSISSPSTPISSGRISRTNCAAVVANGKKPCHM
ncbi:hypothetical protein TNCT_197051 [Trichonephila clavata]|uniref:Uncharacterized protein n=1 Tax=Trichonephila clavata TaxID=2740835 RepID=A0A8X6GBZ9_TRICU|nr:hypothetical protein TNCT_197051 [Trichonephila clavata]